MKVFDDPGHSTKMATMPIYGNLLGGTTWPISTKFGMLHIGFFRKFSSLQVMSYVVCCFCFVFLFVVFFVFFFLGGGGGGVLCDMIGFF